MKKEGRVLGKLKYCKAIRNQEFRPLWDKTFKDSFIITENEVFKFRWVNDDMDQEFEVYANIAPFSVYWAEQDDQDFIDDNESFEYFFIEITRKEYLTGIKTPYTQKDMKEYYLRYDEHKEKVRIQKSHEQRFDL